MADIQIEASGGRPYEKGSRSGVFWTSDAGGGVGYVIFLSGGNDLVYRKTVNGGADWGAQVPIAGVAVCNAASYDCYADWQTAGDAGTKIHIVFASRDNNNIRYIYLDTSDDSVGGNDIIETCQGTGTFLVTDGWSRFMVSITKTRGGNLVVAIKYQDNAVAKFNSFYTSLDAVTWTSKTSPYEASNDYCLLFPGNEADNQDVWGIYWDVSANEISLKTYDDSEDSWSEQAIVSSMSENFIFLQIDGAIRLSDRHLIFAAWSQFNNAAADLMVWDINGAGSITAKTNVLTDSAASFTVSIFINQANDDIYVAYVKGTAIYSFVAAFYQKSTDGGANWDGQTALQADAEDDERWISCGAAKKEWGGKFQPVWFNADFNDIFTNTDNGISIAAAAGGTTHEGAATLSGVGTLAGIGRGIFISKSTLSGTGTLASAGRLTAIGRATLAGTGTLAGIGRLIAIGKATLSGVGTLVAAQTGAFQYGVAALSGTGTLAVIATALLQRKLAIETRNVEFGEVRLIPKASSSGAEGTMFYDSDDNYVYVATE